MKDGALPERGEQADTQGRVGVGDFRQVSAAAARDEGLRRRVQNAVLKEHAERVRQWGELPDVEALRTLAAQIKQHALDHLDLYLAQLVTAVERKGGKVHFAADGEEARRIITQIATSNGSKLCVKSKSMVSEEVELDAALERAGVEVVETDLAEFILQIGHERPSHLVSPSVHKDAESVGRLFSEYFGTAYTGDPQALTEQARVHLREKFRRADLGITGGNFLVAETGDVCIVTNEGNGRLTTAIPRVLVSLVGIEKVVPRMADLAVMLKLLGRSSTGQTMSVYTTLFGGVRAAGEKDGPEEFHLVLLDGGRSEILAGPYRETLRCIRCGACLNACPVYRNIGGHAYGAVYSGPIGAVISPLIWGLARYKCLPEASTLCGACVEACPMRIDIPEHLLRLRGEIVERKLIGFWERMTYRLWAWSYRSAFRYRWACRVQRWVLRRRARGTGWVSAAPLMGRGWTEVRDMPVPAKKTFGEMWRGRDRS